MTTKQKERTTVEAVDDLTKAVRDMHSVLAEILFIFSDDYSKVKAEMMYDEMMQDKLNQNKEQKKGGVVKRS